MKEKSILNQQSSTNNHQYSTFYTLHSTRHSFLAKPQRTQGLKEKSILNQQSSTNNHQYSTFYTLHSSFSLHQSSQTQQFTIRNQNRLFSFAVPMKEERIYKWGQSRRFNSYSQYMSDKFGDRIQKLSVDAGFTCPNRDGSVARGGCTYCDNKSFNPSYNHSHNPIKWQIEEGIKFHENRYRRAKNYIVYFQPYSNTYAPLKFLKQLYEEALSSPNVVGLAIGTRPDCVDDEKLDYLAELNQKYFITIEFGIESIYNNTLERINRGHSFEQTVQAIEAASKRGLHVGSHLIFGLPGESRDMMLDQAQVISALPLSSIKFHQLQIIKRTAMVKDFNENPQDFNLFQLDEYIDFVIKFIEKLNPDFVIERFAGEVPPKFLHSSQWTNLRYDQVLNLIEKRMEELDTWQGRFF